LSLITLMRPLTRVVAAALVGAVAGPVCLILAHSRSPLISFGLLRDLPPIATGFYPVERSGHDAWVWTRERAEITLAGLDRRWTWACVVGLRGGRPGPAAQPDVELALDGARAATFHTTNDYQDVQVTAPPAPGKTGLILTLRSSTTMVPGGRDPRSLGVQVDRLMCHASDAGIVLPPLPPLRTAALAAAAFGAAFGVAFATFGGAVAATLLLAAAQATVMAAGTALFGPFSGTVARLAVWIALLMAAALGALRAALRRAPSAAARFIVAFSAGAFYLKLIALVHPSKPLVDALFHAHRFERVLDGRFYFTQLSTSATPFPYAIGLYLFAAPWSWLTNDHVTLLRIVVVAADALASALLYLLIVRAWSDRLAGAVAVVLSSLLPLWYLIVGSANLTNAFGQSVSTVTMVAAVIWAEPGGWAGRLAGLTLLATLGLLCHVSTFALLLTMLLALAFLYRWKGGPVLRPAATWILIATLAATALSTALYWGHFSSLYAARLETVRAGFSARLAPTDAVTAPADVAATDKGPARGRVFVPLHLRAVGAIRQTVVNVGWPILILALAGAWRVWRERSPSGWPDPLVLALGAMGLTCLLFLAFAVLTAVDVRYQQDAWEFIGRVELLTYPAAVVLAARGAAWACRAGIALRLSSVALLAAAAVLGLRAWHWWLL
jgi:hypothetical protein